MGGEQKLAGGEGNCRLLLQFRLVIGLSFKSGEAETDGESLRRFVWWCEDSDTGESSHAEFGLFDCAQVELPPAFRASCYVTAHAVA
jgi:hypothetical protein